MQKKEKLIKLSVVMPTMNEQESIQKVVTDIKKYAKGYDLEILIVDSSSDNTPKIAESLGVKVIYQKPQGPGKAVILGIKEAKGEIVILSDCDDTYPMNKIPDFIKLWQDGYDFVNGNRLYKRSKAMPYFNYLGNKYLALLVRILFGIRTKDATSGMRLYSRPLIESCEWETNYSFWIEIIIKTKRNGFRFIETPIDYYPRIGEVKMNLWRSGKAFALCLLKYRLNTNKIDTKKL